MQARWLAVALIATCLLRATAADRSIEPIISRIPHQQVDSRALASVGYSKRLHALEIEFRRGGTYRYLDVSPATHRELLAADSKAHFYNTQIRGRYRCVRVRDAHAELRH
jgi:hypothetical protein